MAFAVCLLLAPAWVGGGAEFSPRSCQAALQQPDLSAWVHGRGRDEGQAVAQGELADTLGEAAGRRLGVRGCIACWDEPPARRHEHELTGLGEFDQQADVAVELAVTASERAVGVVLPCELEEAVEHLRVGLPVGVDPLHVAAACRAVAGFAWQRLDQVRRLRPFDAKPAVWRDEPVLGDEPAHVHQELVQPPADAAGVLASDIAAELVGDRLSLDGIGVEAPATILGLQFVDTRALDRCGLLDRHGAPFVDGTAVAGRARSTVCRRRYRRHWTGDREVRGGAHCRISAAGGRRRALRSRASLERSRGTCRRPVVFRELSQTWPMNSPVCAIWTKHMPMSPLRGVPCGWTF